MCEDENLSITALMSAENLENMVTLSDSPRTLYYKIFKIKSKNEYGTITFEPCDDASLYNNGTKAYGQVDVRKYVLKSDGTLDDSTAEIIDRNKCYEFRDGILYLKLIDSKVLNLPQGYDYFIAMTKNLQAPDVTKWADPNNACEVYSKFFLPKKTQRIRQLMLKRSLVRHQSCMKNQRTALSAYCGFTAAAMPPAQRGW